MVLPATFQTKPTTKVRERRRELELQLAELKRERTTFESHWRDMSDFMSPRGARFLITDNNKGDRLQNQKIIDNSAGMGARTLSAGMMGGVTSPAREWFRLALSNPEFAQSQAVKEWLDDLTRRMSTMFLQSNVYKTLPKTYKGLAIFGTSSLFVEEDFEKVMRTHQLPIGAYWVSNNEAGIIDVFMREFRMTVRQIVEKFGRTRPGGPIDWSNISVAVRNHWETAKHKEAWVDVIHVVVPNPEFDPEKLGPEFKKYASVYWEKGTTNDMTLDGDKFLRESGYDHFPVLVVRWEVGAEDIYGTDCPGMTALGDVKQLQHGEKRGMQAVDKHVNPSLKAPMSLKTAKVSLLPGDVTYVDELEGRKGLTPIHTVEPRIDTLEKKQDQVRKRISRAFFEDLFLLLALSDRREMTAREVEEKHEEKLLILGPVLEQLNQDLLDPLIEIAFELMQRQGLIPPAPPEIQGQQIKVEYVSVMAQAQKLAGLAAVERFVGFVAQVAQYAPDVLDKIDTDQLVDTYADIVGVPAKLLHSSEEVQAIREARAQAQAQAEAAATAAQGAETAKNLSQADVGGQNALRQLIEAAQAGNLAPTTEETVPAA
jgi:hypothetical protein